MKNKRFLILTAFASLLIIAGVLGCGNASDILFPGTGSAVFQFFAPKFAFVFNGDGTGTITSWKVDATSGALTVVTAGLATDFSASNGGRTVDIDADPNSKFLIVPNLDSNTVSVFTVGTDGSVTGPTGADVSSGGNQAYAVRLHPSGRFAYVTNRLSNTVAAFSVGANGALTAVGSPVATGVFPEHLIMDWQGRFLYVTHQSWYGTDANPNPANQDNMVDAFAIDSQTGALTKVPGSPFNTGITPRGGIVDYSGQYLIIANRGNDNDTNDSAGADPGSISVFSIGSTGALTSVGTFKDPACTSSASCGPFNIAEAIVNGTAYIAANNLDSSNLSVFTMDTATGKLTLVNGSPFDLGFSWPHYIAVDTSGKFGYVVDYNHENITQFALGSTGATAVGTPFSDPSLATPTGIVFSH